MFDGVFVNGLPLIGPEPMCGGTDWLSPSEIPQTGCWEWQWSSKANGGVTMEGTFRFFEVARFSPALIIMIYKDVKDMVEGVVRQRLRLATDIRKMQLSDNKRRLLGDANVHLRVGLYSLPFYFFNLCNREGNV